LTSQKIDSTSFIPKLVKISENKEKYKKYFLRLIRKNISTQKNKAENRKERIKNNMQCYSLVLTVSL